MWVRVGVRVVPLVAVTSRIRHHAHAHYHHLPHPPRTNPCTTFSHVDSTGVWVRS